MGSFTRRRQFLKVAGVAGFGLGGDEAVWAGAAQTPQRTARQPLLKPSRLQEGDLVALVNPASATFVAAELDLACDVVTALGLRVKRGAQVLARYGYLAGRDQDRAADLMAMFMDPR